MIETTRWRIRRVVNKKQEKSKEKRNVPEEVKEKENVKSRIDDKHEIQFFNMTCFICCSISVAFLPFIPHPLSVQIFSFRSFLSTNNNKIFYQQLR